METPKRRSRMRRISTGKRIELTDRDIELFKLLNRYHYLRSNFLYAFLGGGSETRLQGTARTSLPRRRIYQSPDAAVAVCELQVHAGHLRTRYEGRTGASRT